MNPYDDVVTVNSKSLRDLSLRYDISVKFLIFYYFSRFSRNVVIKIESPLTSLQLYCGNTLTLNIKYPEKVRIYKFIENSNKNLIKINKNIFLLYLYFKNFSA